MLPAYAELFLCASNFLILINVHFQSALYYGRNKFLALLHSVLFHSWFHSFPWAFTLLFQSPVDCSGCSCGYRCVSATWQIGQFALYFHVVTSNSAFVVIRNRKPSTIQLLKQEPLQSLKRIENYRVMGAKSGCARPPSELQTSQEPEVFC